MNSTGSTWNNSIWGGRNIALQKDFDLLAVLVPIWRAISSLADLHYQNNNGIVKYSIFASKLEKIPRGIRGERSIKYMASSRNLVSTTGAQTSPKTAKGDGGRNQVSERVILPCWLATPVANAPWKPLIIRRRSGSVLRSWNCWKVWFVGKSLLVKGQNAI